MAYQVKVIRAESRDALIPLINTEGANGWYLVTITEEYTTDVSKVWQIAWMQKVV